MFILSVVFHPSGVVEPSVLTHVQSTPQAQSSGNSELVDTAETASILCGPIRTVEGLPGIVTEQQCEALPPITLLIYDEYTYTDDWEKAAFSPPFLSNSQLRFNLSSTYPKIERSYHATKLAFR